MSDFFKMHGNFASPNLQINRLVFRYCVVSKYLESSVVIQTTKIRAI